MKLNINNNLKKIDKSKKIIPKIHADIIDKLHILSRKTIKIMTDYNSACFLVITFFSTDTSATSKSKEYKRQAWHTMCM